jgi:hypothetical protein
MITDGGASAFKRNSVELIAVTTAGPQIYITKLTSCVTLNFMFQRFGSKISSSQKG